MSNYTISAVQDAGTKENGTRLIMLRATLNRKHKHAGTGISIPKKDFNPNGTFEKANWVRASHDMAETYNQSIKNKIKSVREKAEAYEKKGVPVTLELLQKIMKGQDSNNFIQFYREFIEQYNTDKQGRLYEKYIDNLNKFLRFTNGRELPFQELTVPLFEKYEKWLMTSYTPLGKDGKPKPNGKPNNQNTASKSLSFIKTVIRAAVKAKLIKQDDNPFISYTLKTIKTKKTSLKKTEIEQFAEVEIPEHLRAFHSRNIFFCQYYCVGTRIGDMLTMRWPNLDLKVENGVIISGRIFFSMEKTESPRNYIIPQKAIKILNYYYPNRTNNGFIFPFLSNDIQYTIRTLEKAIESKTATINKDLKVWTKKAGIEKHVTTHVARHSFAGESIRMGVSIFDLRDLLGHADVKDTQIYAQSVDEESLDKFITKVFD